MCGQATTSKKKSFTQLNCTCRVWGYCSKVSLKDFQQSNVPTFKTGSSISNNCTDHLRYIIIIIMAGMAVFNVAGYLIEERRRWPVNYRFPTRTMF